MRAILLSLTILLTPASAAASEAADAPPSARPSGHPVATLARFPNSDGTHLVFSARGHIWTSPLAGGAARRMTEGDSYETAPRYSPDGRWIAFTGDRGGQQDVYVIPATGGEPRRLTWLTRAALSNGVRRATQEGLVVAWTPDSQNVVFLSRQKARNSWGYRPFAVPVAGGPATALPVDRSGYLSFGPDGRTMAMNRIFSEFRTWKRYTGGLQQDVEIYDPATRRSETITDWNGNDGTPMWSGDRIYFTSDRDPTRKVNIWVYDRRDRTTRQVTRFTNYDVDVPSLGGGVISFQQGGRLWTLDVATERLRPIDVAVPDDGARTVPRNVDVASMVRTEDTDYDTDFRLSPDGKAALLSARGEIFLVPLSGGPPRNLTSTPGAEEDHPAWSPDGRLVAYTTDSGGEQQLAVRLAAGGRERRLTHFSSGFLYQPTWSSDGRFIAIHDAAHRLWLVPTSGGRPRLVAYNRHHYMHEVDEHDAAFSPDGRWLAYSLSRPTRLRALHLYDIATERDVEVSRADDSDYRPSFSPDGRHLWFVSDRHAISVQSDRETNAVTAKSAGLYVASLSASTPPLFQPDAGERTRPDAAPQPPNAPTPDKPSDRRSEPAAPGTRPASTPSAGSLRVNVDGLMARAVPAPVAPAKIVSMDVFPDAVLYRTQAPDTMSGSLPGEPTTLRRLDLASARDEVVVAGLDAHIASADGGRVLYTNRGQWKVADALPGAPNVSSVDLSGMKVRSDPRAEWREMFENVWRLQRDLFVNADMNGNDWRAVHDAYARLLPLVGTRDDLNWLIGQMIGEIGSSHTYVGGGDDGQVAATAPTPRLGADFELDPASGRYRIARILRGDSTRDGERSPLGWPGLDVREGDYLLAINGRDLVAPDTPEASLEGARGRIALTVADRPDGRRRTVTVSSVSSEWTLRELEWVRRNRAIVDRLSGGRIGYVYVTDMQNRGMEQFVRGFYPQLGKEALIIDDRWNGGGNTDQILLERLRRTLSSMQTMRDRVPQTQPDQVQVGLKAMLMNHFSASDGDMFPYHFRAYGLGPLVGTRTWGGVRGIRTFWTLLDGGYVTIPEITFSSLDSKWVLENRGNVPDVEIEDQPWEEEAGTDSQLEAAVRNLMDGLDARVPPPALAPAAPRYAPGGEVPPIRVGRNDRPR